MRLCKDCSNIYEVKDETCPKCKSLNTCELHGVGITPTHEQVRFSVPGGLWFGLAFAALIAYAGVLISSSSARGIETSAADLLMIAAFTSLFAGILLILVPLRKSKRLFLVCCMLVLAIVVLSYLGTLGAMAFLPLALLPVSLMILLPHWRLLR